MKNIQLNEALAIWTDYYSENNEHYDEAEDPDHLSVAVIYHMATTGGIKDARKHEIEHLSMCTACMGQWAACLNAADITPVHAADGYDMDEQYNNEIKHQSLEEPGNHSDHTNHSNIDFGFDELPNNFMNAEPPEIYMSYGFLEAASSAPLSDLREPLFLKSSCKKFILGVLPQIENPKKGMITLEALSGIQQDVEGFKATVQDAAGRAILKGTLLHGRSAERVDDINQFDLSTWSVVLTSKESGEYQGKNG